MCLDTLRQKLCFPNSQAARLEEIFQLCYSYGIVGAQEPQWWLVSLFVYPNLGSAIRPVPHVPDAPTAPKEIGNTFRQTQISIFDLSDSVFNIEPQVFNVWSEWLSKYTLQYENLMIKIQIFSARHKVS